MIKSLQDIRYDFLVTLSIIKQDSTLSNIFKKKFNLDINIISYQYKKNLLRKDIGDYVKELFDNIILTNDNLLEKYILAKNSLKSVEEIVIDEGEEIKKLPKHFGKAKTLEKIKQQGHETSLDKALLACNELRNIYEKLLKKCINDVYREEKKLTEEEYNNIINGVKEFKTKLK